MKSAAACILILHLLISTLASSGLAEVTRLPALFEHFQVHLVESGGTLTLGEFLVMHYADAEHERKDHGRHGNLPFHNTSLTHLIFIPNNALMDLFDPSELVTEYVPVKDLWKGEWLGRAVFQPPKLAF